MVMYSVSVFRFSCIIFVLLICNVLHAQSDSEIQSQQDARDLKVLISEQSWSEAQVKCQSLLDHFSESNRWDSLYKYRAIIADIAKNTGDLDVELEALGSNISQDVIFRSIHSEYEQNIRYMMSRVDTIRAGSEVLSTTYDIFSNYLFENGLVDSAILIGYKAIRQSDKSDIADARILTRIEQNLKLRSIRNLKSGLILLMEAESISSTSATNPVSRIRLYKSIGETLLEVEDIDKSKSYLEKAYDLAEAEGYSSFKSDVELVLGRVDVSQGKLVDGIAKYKNVLDVFRQKEMKYKRDFSYYYIADAYYKSRQYDLSKSYLDSFELANAKSFPLHQILEARHALLDGNDKEVLDFINFANRKSVDFVTHGDDVYDIKYQYYKSKGDETNALINHEKLKKYQDSLFASNQAIKVHRIENEFNRKQKNIEISALKKTTEAQDRALDLRNAMILMGSIMLLVLSGLLFGLYRLYRTNQKNQKQLSEQNVQISQALAQNQVLMKEIHHRVKNNLQVVSSLLSMQARKVTDVDTKEALNSSRTRVQSMSLLHQNLYQGEEITEVNVSDYIEEMVKTIVNTYNVNDNIELNLDIENLDLDVDVLMPLGLVANELICNALKYAFVGRDKGKLDISLESQGDTIIFRVKDDGVGLAEDSLPVKKESLGARLINLFTERLGGKLDVKGSNGTEVIITSLY